MGEWVAPGVEVGCVGIGVLSEFFRIGLSIFKGCYAEFFGKFSLEVVPAGLTPGFRVKFGVGLDNFDPPQMHKQNQQLQLLPNKQHNNIST